MTRANDDGDQRSTNPGEARQLGEGTESTARPDAPNRAARRTILARRARFVTIALAGAGLAAASQGCKDPKPEVCLSEVEVQVPPDADTEPQICLSPEELPEDQPPEDQPPEDGGAPPGTADTDAKADAGQPRPKMCLRMAPPDPPRPCLSEKPPVLPPRPCLSRPPDKPAPTS